MLLFYFPCLELKTLCFFCGVRYMFNVEMLLWGGFGAMIWFPF